jgi:hypothetical protein
MGTGYYIVVNNYLAHSVECNLLPQWAMSWRYTLTNTHTITHMHPNPLKHNQTHIDIYTNKSHIHTYTYMQHKHVQVCAQSAACTVRKNQVFQQKMKKGEALRAESLLEREVQPLHLTPDFLYTITVTLV